VIIELGGNDGPARMPVPAMRKNLSAMIEQSQKGGARVLLVGMRMPPNYGPQYTGEFERAFTELAKQHGTALVRFSSRTLRRARTTPTGRHPPDRAAQPVMLGDVWKRAERKLLM
jgi:acyl-CoA thioesterase-1